MEKCITAQFLSAEKDGEDVGLREQSSALGVAAASASASISADHLSSDDADSVWDSEFSGTDSGSDSYNLEDACIDM